MHLPSKQSDLLTDLALKLQGLAELLCNGLDAPIEEIAASANLLAQRPSTQLMLLLEGQVNCCVDGKVVMHYEAGDLMGLTNSLQLPSGELRHSHPIRVKIIDRTALMNHIGSDAKYLRHWTHYLLCAQSFLEQALAQEIRVPFQPTTGFLHFQTGDTIIHQGSAADRVYTLLEGSADAVCDGTKVGEVHQHEIFGALAVFTRQTRMASIVATSECSVLAVPKEEFIDLIEHQPQICLTLIEEMASKINQLNAQLKESKEQR